MNKKKIKIKKMDQGILTEAEDVVALEQVFPVKINGENVFTLRCTPEHLEELVLGHLLTERWIEKLQDVFKLVIRQEEISVELFRKSSSSWKKSSSSIYESSKLLVLAEEFFRQEGELFRSTGCAHCCGLARGASFVSIYEDVGRHNALDKAVGAALRQGIPLEETAAFTTGRISGDYLRKASNAGIKTLVSRAAVTSEAVSLAESLGITMLGFVRGNRANLYTGEKHE